jgi:hypothetical protein
MTIALDGIDTLDALIDEIETVIEGLTVSDTSSAATAYTLLDRLDQTVHLGVLVSAPESSNADRADGRTFDWHEDTLSIVLRCNVARSAGQRAGRNEALAHERQIRNAILLAPTLHPFHPRWRGTTRTKSADLAWLEIDQRIGFGRLDRRQLAAA